MATRRYIQEAAPYASINSTCFVASVQYNHSIQKHLVPVYLPTGEAIPTTQAKTMDLIDQINIPADQSTIETSSMKFAVDDIGSTIDGCKADYDLHFGDGGQVHTESI